MSNELTSLSPTLLKELGKVNRYLEDLRDLAVKAGVNEAGFTYTNAVLALDKRLSQLNECEQVAKEQGYGTLAIALKALGQIRKPLAELPERIRYAPSHWVISDYYRTEEVFKNGKRTERKILVRGRTARTAQRLRDGLEGMLQELWYRTETDSEMNEEEKEAYKREVIEKYQNPEVTYERFAKMVLDGLHGTDYPEDEEINSTKCTGTSDPELAAKLDGYRQDCEAAGVTYDEGAARVLLIHHAK
jgi:hypothetical protein